MEINQDVLEKLKSIYLYHLEQYELTDNPTHYGYLQGMLYTLHKLGISWDFIVFEKARSARFEHGE